MNQTFQSTYLATGYKSTLPHLQGYRRLYLMSGMLCTPVSTSSDATGPLKWAAGRCRRPFWGPRSRKPGSGLAFTLKLHPQAPHPLPRRRRTVRPQQCQDATTHNSAVACHQRVPGARVPLPCQVRVPHGSRRPSQVLSVTVYSTACPTRVVCSTACVPETALCSHCGFQLCHSAAVRLPHTARAATPAVQLHILALEAAQGGGAGARQH